MPLSKGVTKCAHAKLLIASKTEFATNEGERDEGPTKKKSSQNVMTSAAHRNGRTGMRGPLSHARSAGSEKGKKKSTVNSKSTRRRRGTSEHLELAATPDSSGWESSMGEKRHPGPTEMDGGAIHVIQS